MDTGEIITISGYELTIEKLLGRGKSGYSYLAECGHERYVLKALHHEPCDYYTFGDKFASELAAYEALTALNVPLPRLIASDRGRELLLKEYIDGPTKLELAKCGRLEPRHIDLVRALANRLRLSNINIDYYPSNFIERHGALYYVDYEFNEYMERWSFDVWGEQYWRNLG